MADERARRLERAWREGDPEAGVATLRLRLREGTLAREHVRLLSHLGVPAAERVCPEARYRVSDHSLRARIDRLELLRTDLVQRGDAVALRSVDRRLRRDRRRHAARWPFSDEPFARHGSSLSHWGALVLERYGEQAAVRVAEAALAHARAHVESTAVRRRRARVERVHAGLEGWVACPCEQHAETVRRIRLGGLRGARALLRACQYAVRAFQFRLSVDYAWTSYGGFGSGADWIGCCVDACAAEAGRTAVVRSIRRSLTAWVLDSAPSDLRVRGAR